MVNPKSDAGTCTKVKGQTWIFLDGECSAAVYARVCRHLEQCPNCLEHYALEGRIKHLIATKCGGDVAPERVKLICASNALGERIPTDQAEAAEHDPRSPAGRSGDDKTSGRTCRRLH